MSEQHMRMWLVSQGFTLEEVALIEEACVLNAARRGVSVDKQRDLLMDDFIYFGTDYWHKRIAQAAALKAVEEKSAKLMSAEGTLGAENTDPV